MKKRVLAHEHLDLLRLGRGADHGSGGVQGTERFHLGLGQFEAEDIEVLLDALLMDALRNDDDAKLNQEVEENLRGRASLPAQ